MQNKQYNQLLENEIFQWSVKQTDAENIDKTKGTTYNSILKAVLSRSSRLIQPKRRYKQFFSFDLSKMIPFC